MKATKYFIIITIATLLFCLAVGFDVSPYLRGPGYYPPEWRWEYFFVNTVSRIYAPVLISLFLIGLFWLSEKKKLFKQKKLLFFLLITLGFLFQISILFFSRSGVAVLLHRIINPGLNSYFTAALLIKDIPDFLHNYNQLIIHFVYHAGSHPPGAILLFYFIKQLVTPFSFFIHFANHLTPSHTDVRLAWNTLLPLDKATAVFASLLMPLLSMLSLIPLYYCGKLLYGTKIALRSIFLFLFIPSIVFFIPINDSFLHIFSITAFFFFLKGIQKNNTFSLFLSGFILFLGVFFNLSLLPMLILFFIFALLYLRKEKSHFNNYIKYGSFFTAGFLIPPLLLLLFFQFNFIQMIQTIMHSVTHVHTRSYWLWIFYNIYDFLIFATIPISLVFLTEIKQTAKKLIKKQWENIDPLFISFFLMLLIVNFSGSVRGETGRIWAPFIPFMTLLAAAFLTDKIKLSTKLFAGILLLQILQILVMQEFWVMLW